MEKAKRIFYPQCQGLGRENFLCLRLLSSWWETQGHSFLFITFECSRLLKPTAYSVEHKCIINMSEIKEITAFLLAFRDERAWEPFHNPKDLAIGINVEAGELLEQFLWKAYPDADAAKVKEELADIFVYGFFMAHTYGWDIKEIVMEKMAANALKYPIEKSKGNAKKYNEF